MLPDGATSSPPVHGAFALNVNAIGQQVEQLQILRKIASWPRNSAVEVSWALGHAKQCSRLARSIARAAKVPHKRTT
jgi:hypothetical protein